jgi:hypothetical protein
MYATTDEHTCMEMIAYTRRPSNTRFHSWHAQIHVFFVLRAEPLVSFQRAAVRCRYRGVADGWNGGGVGAGLSGMGGGGWSRIRVW